MSIDNDITKTEKINSMYLIIVFNNYILINNITYIYFDTKIVTTIN